MPVVSEPIPIPPESPNALFFYNAQITELSRASRNMSLTQRDGAIQDDDKVGNLDSVYVVFTSNGTANTQDTVAHNLLRTPVGYFPVKQDKAAVLYDGTTTFTTTNIYFRTSVATVAWTVAIF